MRRYLASPFAEAALLAAVAVAFGGACGASPKPSVPAASDPPASSAAIRFGNNMASTCAASGTFVCAPPPSLVEACKDKAAGAACELFKLPDGSALDGVCRATIDGVALACGPKFPAPPQEMVEPCQGKASGDACKVARPGGQERDGKCTMAFDDVTLVCGRVFTPPDEITKPCASAAAGDKCSVSLGDASHPVTFEGVCSLGPAGSGTLACTPAQDLAPEVTSPCKGLAAGATCSVGEGDWALTGKCVTPAAGGEGVCVVECDKLAGDRPVPHAYKPPCEGLAAGEACTIGQGQWAISGKCAEPAAGAPMVCVGDAAGGSGGVPPGFKPPCEGLAAGAACTIGQGQWAISGKCAEPVAGAPLMCVGDAAGGGSGGVPPGFKSPCEGLAAGAACTIGEGRWAMSGKCAEPVAGAPLMCVGDHAGGGTTPSIPGFKSPCEGLAVGAACTVGEGQWAMSGKCAEPFAGAPVMCVLACDDAQDKFQCGPQGP